VRSSADDPSSPRLRNKRIREFLFAFTSTGDLPTNFSPGIVLRFFKEAIERTGTSLRSLANLNRTVHSPTYERVFHEEAAAVGTKHARDGRAV
jgi:hypothetical protein